MPRRHDVKEDSMNHGSSKMWLIGVIRVNLRLKFLYDTDQHLFHRLIVISPTRDIFGDISYKVLGTFCHVTKWDMTRTLT